MVPVLSAHSTSTRASTSIAGSSCTRQRLLGEAHHTDGEGDAGEQHETFGHHAHEAGDGADDACCQPSSRRQNWLLREQQPDRDDQVADPGDDAVDVVAQR